MQRPDASLICDLFYQVLSTRNIQHVKRNQFIQKLSYFVEKSFRRE
ncbi:MAG: hypothetical protein GTO14_03290 [Anaerolineales bacterium]|nr:hypothetical protein [Anaerolineales bacterium]